jgi:hypothetical protein
VDVVRPRSVVAEHIALVTFGQVGFDFAQLDLVGLYRRADRMLAQKPALEVFLWIIVGVRIAADRPAPRCDTPAPRRRSSDLRISPARAISPGRGASFPPAHRRHRRSGGSTCGRQGLR